MAIATTSGWKPGQQWNWTLPGYDPSGGAGAASTSGFNLNPLPESGTNAFGEVPGQLGLPNPAGDLGNQLPGLPKLNQAASDVVGDELGGTLAPGTIDALRNANASWAVGNGMPGSNLSYNRLFGNIVGASEDRRRKGIQDYNSIVPTVSGTQTVRPELQNEIASQNALNKAAPNPAKAASYAQQLYDQYLQKMRGPGGGTGGYSNSPAGGTGQNVPRGTSSNPFSNPLPDVYDPNMPSTASSNGVDYSYDPSDPFAQDFEAYNAQQSPQNDDEFASLFE